MTPRKQVRALFDASTITVYQAYRPEIAHAAVAAQRFVAPFSMTRMTWVKPSFLWMMERCGWATKPEQDRVLAIAVRRDDFERWLAQAALTDHDVSGAPTRVQWDPERDLRGGKLGHRSLQLGLGRSVAAQYANDVVRIDDVTPLVRRIAVLRAEGEWDRAFRLLPVERPYALPERIALHLGATG
jgi:hypothetical protein